MRELELKAHALSELRRRGMIKRGDALASEFVVAGSARRADLAAMSTHFIGVEIKSEFDTLRRLGGQLSAFASTFDRVILVIAGRHAEAALEVAPTGTEVWNFDPRGECTVLQHGEVHRASTPGRSSLLTVAALRRLTTSAQSVSRRDLIASAEALPRDAIDNEVRLEFADKYAVTSERFWARSRGRNVTPTHVKLLSPYAPFRREQATARSEQQTFWATWAEQATAHVSLNAL